MPKYARIRPPVARWRDWLPLAVLIIALASAIALGGDRGYFHRWGGSHNQMTVKNLAIAENMSPKHNFRLATGIRRNADGGFKYDLYGRFPVGGYALIKLAMSPFGSDLAAKLLAAQVLMLLMFCGAAIFAYLALARIAGSRWIALAATLLAFSSLYPLYYADSVAGESVMDLFGAALVFHGMAVFVQEGRFRQLLIKTCAALLLGWHVYALILPFALWGFGGEALALARSARASGGGMRAALSALPALARSRFAALAAGAILFGSALLALNFANEYAAHDGNRSLLNLPSVESMMKRLRITDHFADRAGSAPGDFLRLQFLRAGVASAPYAVEGLGGRRFPAAEPEAQSPARAARGIAALGGGQFPAAEPEPPSPARAAWGIAASVAALAALALVPRRFRVPMGALALMGFCWALAARGQAYDEYHAHEGVFYIGLPLALWAGALIGARRLLGARLGGALAIGIAALAAPALALSALSAAQVRLDADAAKRAKETMADMSAIREIVSEKSFAVSPDAMRMVDDYGRFQRVMNYYLAGSYFRWGASADADYAVVRHRDESLSLTPGNRHLFLYERADLSEARRAETRRLESSEPDARSEFDVYFEEGALRYLKSPCAPWDADAPFFAHFYPPDAAYLRGEGDPIGFEGVNFPFADVSDVDGGCMATASAPSYPIAAIRTGQYVSGGESLWDVSIFPPPSADTLAAYESAYQTVADGEPAGRSGFDLHLNGNGTISYLKRPCSEDDVRGRFFLSVHPANAADLPAERREAGHDSLNFDFVPPHGVVFNGKCMATIQLPDYEISKIATGQDAPGAGALWESAIFPPPSADTLAAYESDYQAVADGEPAAQSEFDIYLDAEGGTLSYLKEPCSEEDARGRFYLSVRPVEIGDLPEDRRELGHESLRFDFYPPLGAIFNGKCMATIQLPDYEIAKLETRQDAPDSGALWESAIFPPPSAERIAAYESAYQTIADGEPATQSGFDLYLDADGDTLAYLKQPCSEEDARGRFFLSVHPANADDLPAERREIGHESLNFDFEPPHGVVFNGKCMATRQLPDYEIAKIETGQDAPGGGRLWTAEIAVGD